MKPGTMTLLAYIVVLVPLMLLGFYFARRKMFNPHHKLVMTSVVILNWIFIAIVMANTYRLAVAPNIPQDIGQIRHLLPTIHLLIGGTAQILATYLVILMWTENTALAPLAIIRTRNIKPIMRTTLALWLITVLLGIGIYAVFNAPSSNAETPIVTEEATESADIEAVTTEEAANPAATEAAEDPNATEESGD